MLLISSARERQTSTGLPGQRCGGCDSIVTLLLATKAWEEQRCLDTYIRRVRRRLLPAGRILETDKNLCSLRAKDFAPVGCRTRCYQWCLRRRGELSQRSPICLKTVGLRKLITAISNPFYEPTTNTTITVYIEQMFCLHDKHL